MIRKIFIGAVHAAIRTLFRTIVAGGGGGVFIVMWSSNRLLNNAIFVISSIHQLALEVKEKSKITRF